MKTLDDILKDNQKIISLNTEVFAIVRKTDNGNEFIDISTLSHLSERTTELSEKCEKENPIWFRAHPVVRLTKVTLSEVPK